MLLRKVLDLSLMRALELELETSSKLFIQIQPLFPFSSLNHGKNRVLLLKPRIHYECILYNSDMESEISKFLAES